MSEEKPDIDRTRLRRVTVVVRSWDGPNSRVGFEMDLNQMPWGPFDALGQQLDLLLPASPEAKSGGPEVESEISKALRHVEHAADRCAEFAQASDGSREMWLSSQQTWEWVRRYLTSLWVQEEVEGDTAQLLGTRLPGREEAEAPEVAEGPAVEETEARRSHPPPPVPSDLPSLPGAAATIKAAAKALRSTPLSVWREKVEGDDPEAPTREEAVQTLLGVAKILDARSRGDEIVIEVVAPEGPSKTIRESEPPSAPASGQEPDFEQVSFDFAEGYDQGYQMGRKVGWALASRHRTGPRKGGGSGGEP
jgi:hypothetical protein